ncbi:YkvA family protein [Sporosarcina pasteurii]|uniref:Uncharacterized conserved protein n=1 Tax=Sporosarcina pasteurii TaxID=1474 RepID=A0A380C7H4_SPOPA|nr:YkvA family protein [Sporosarcina pasteurii]MDS9471811.1 YkvA family protein [Sporosarcina pasteurii]QBQ04597.1 DUF1232 domain-containing protein [Sporosarcina pasteurii]SUJ13941.1 Uncharacterized conserved protein [Sporosarcina pasteurii]
MKKDSWIKHKEDQATDEQFWDKLMKFGKRIGEKTVYYSLLLYYTAKSPSVPKSSKMIIVGALSYLIFPVDVIPDFIPVVGLADDSAVIAAAVYKVFSHIDDSIKNQAKEKLTTIFGETSDS